MTTNTDTALAATQPQDEPAQEKALSPYIRALEGAKDRFVEIMGGDQRAWDSESVFAMQLIMKTDFAMKIANQNPTSVKLAMYNAASTGLTLNPANGYAYLVPRDQAIRLDISYKGLIKIATDTGSVEWVRAEVVYEKDSFIYHGPATMPTHSCNPFNKERGEIIGVYCIAKVASGDVLTEIMDLEEIEKIRSKSDAWVRGAAGRKGPWETFFSEMCRKAVIKRAQKTWPYTDRSDRLANAIEIANEAEGGYSFEPSSDDVPKAVIADQRRQRCDDAYDQYGPSVDLIKECIQRWDDSQDPDELHTVAETWAGIPSAAQMDLWLAPTKGGIFTTHERDVIKTKLPG